MAGRRGTLTSGGILLTALALLAALAPAHAGPAELRAIRPAESIALQPPPASEAVGIEAAVELLSRYPMGQVPVEPATMGAIHTIADEGDRADVGVLRSLVEHERAEIRGAAMAAIEVVRARQRAGQRAAYAAGLPTEEELALASIAWRRLGLGKTSARAAAYATLVLGDERRSDPGPRAGDARRLLATGQPRKALAALAQTAPTAEDLALLATAREDAGDVRGALQAHTLLALTGAADSEAVLVAYGIAPETLYLGLLVMERDGPVGDQEAPLLEALVRRGGLPAAEVLSERMFTAGGSERASAADALIRMLDRSDLADSTRGRIREALVKAVEEGPPPVRDIAASGL